MSTNPNDTDPSIAIDAAGHTHVLYAGGGLHYEACDQPLCSAQPGLRWWTDAPGAGAARRVTDFGDDVSPSIVRGLDGSLSAAFVNTQWRLAEVRLARPLATVSAPVVHLAGPGTTLERGSAALARHVRRDRGRHLPAPGQRQWRRVRDRRAGQPVDVAGGVGEAGRLGHAPVPGDPVRRVRRAGRRRLRARRSGCRPGARRRARRSTTPAPGPRPPTPATSAGTRGSASAPGATATWTFTGREVAWVAAKGRHYGRATVTIDGVLRGTVDLDAAKTRFRRVVFRATWAASGTHSISIRALGDGRVDLDGFELLR